MNTPSSFDVTTFRSRLRAVGCPLGEPLHYYVATTSTNDEAKTAAQLGAPSGATFVADHQTAGRGRLGRQWLSSPSQQLLVSVLWRDNRDLPHAALTLAVGVSLHRALVRELSTSAPLALKWPNDLESEQRKLGGVLVESGVDLARTPYLVIGFGLNVHPLRASVATPRRPISLAELGVNQSREVLLTSVLTELHRGLVEFQQQGPEGFVAYLNQHHALAGEIVTVGDVRGTVVGVATTGALVIDTPSGRREVTTGTVERQAAEG